MAVVVAMTSFGCTAQTKRGQSFHKTGIVTDGTELAFSMLFQSHFCCAIKAGNKHHAILKPENIKLV